MPTKEQIQEFWGRCGFRQVTVRARAFEVVRGKKHSWETCEQRWLQPNCEFEDKLYSSYHGVPFVDWDLPFIDLNNLFKYAVPKLFEMGYDYRLWSDDGYHFFYIYKRFHLEKPIFHSIGYVEAKDAVFATIYKALGGK